MKTTSALALVLAVFLVACGRDSSRTTDSVGGAATLVAQAPGAQVRVADLAKPIDQYTGDEFFAHVRGLRYTGGVERQRRCRGCTGPRDSVRTPVRVDGVQGVDSIGGANIPQFGVVVARGLNRGNDQEDRYGMRPGARYEYYLIVLPGAAGSDAGRWRIEELEINGNLRARRQLATGRVVGCNHTFQRGAASDFRSCTNAPDAAPASLGVFLLQGGTGDDPWWYRCAMGCCIAEDGSEA